MEQGHPQVDKHGSHEFIEWQADKQQLHKQRKLRSPPKVDRHGSHEFVEWQQQQQLLHKQMKLKSPPKIDRHGSIEFVEWQQEQNQIYKEMSGVEHAVVQQGPQQQMKGPQQQMKGPQQQMKAPQQQMNGVADPDQKGMTRLQAEADKEVEEHKRRLAEQKRKANEPPPPPKTITVMAGSKNRPAWPIAPGIANANQPRQITLISGEDEQEWEKNRLSVAEAAGLKHVDITIGDQADIYGQGYNGDSAWSGSLRPTGHKMGKGGKGQDQQDGKNPWEGSLRH